MGYYEQSLLSQDQDFLDRVSASAAIEKPDPEMHPVDWANAHIWAIAAAPGFAESYTYAIATEVPNPGRDRTVISDEQILAAIQAEAAAP